jgi:cytochrome P450
VVDLCDPDLYLAGPPHELFAELRRTSPVYWNDGAERYWAVLTHAGVEQVARDPQTFSSAEGGVVLEDLDPPRLEQMRGMLLAMDPPQHREVRRPLVARLTPKKVAVLEDDIRTICRDVFATVDGQVEFVSEVAAKLPTRVIGQVMGLPRADWDRVHALAERITRGQDPAYADGPDSAGQASQEMGVYAYTFATDRAELADQPEDLTGVLLASRDPAAFASLFVQLVTAGQDTTATLIAAGLLALLQHPDQLDTLRTDYSLVPGAVEEMLRYANPLHYFRRTATTDTTLHDTKIRAGDKVAMYYTSANRDEDVFPDPQAFDITRSPNRHLSFGIAEHFCIGAHLARLEARVFVEELLATYPSVELAGEPVRLRSNLNNALRTLPVGLRPGSAARLRPRDLRLQAANASFTLLTCGKRRPHGSVRFY